jgi:flagellar export protein FliJ
MKKFTFPLSRVSDWKHAQARSEEIKLGRLLAELRAIGAREALLKRERGEAERALLAVPVASGFELAALDAFQRYTEAERIRIAHARADCARRIAAQLEVVNGKRREVRLIENLKERRLKTWQAELGREIDREADEAYLAKWNLR